MTTYLDNILSYKADEVAAAKRQTPLHVLEERIKLKKPPRGFLKALQRQKAHKQIGLIAEIKKASPSKGLIRSDFNAAALAAAYQQGGATCLSVLTDTPSFQGCLDDLTQAQNACALPVLRKDFIIDSYQIAEARAAGADCVLLIAAALDRVQLQDFLVAAQAFHLDILIEVHDAEDLERVLPLNVPLIGINNRNLHDFTVDIQRTIDMLPLLPPSTLVASESGFFTGTDMKRVMAQGVSTFLIGESLMRQHDIAQATKALLASAAA